MNNTIEVQLDLLRDEYASTMSTRVGQIRDYSLYSNANCVAAQPALQRNKFTWVLLHVLYYEEIQVAHARERTLVTVVSRLRARVAPSVLFGAQQSPHWPGNQGETLAVTEIVPKVT